MCRRRSRPRRRRQQHGLVAAVGHQEVAGAVDGHGHGVPQLRRAGGAALAGRAADAGARHGVEAPGRHRLPEERRGSGREHPHPAVGGVGDEEVARARRPPPPVGSSSSLAVAVEAVAVEAGPSRARHRHRRSGPRRHAPPAPAAPSPPRCRRHRARRPPRSVGWPMPPRAGAAAPGERGDVAGPQVQPVERPGPGRHDDHPAVPGVGDEEVARRIERDPARRVEHSGADHGAHAGAAPARPAPAAARGGATAASDTSAGRATPRSRRTGSSCRLPAAAGTRRRAIVGGAPPDHARTRDRKKRREGGRRARTRRSPHRRERDVHRLRGRPDQRLPGPPRR